MNRYLLLIVSIFMSFLIAQGQEGDTTNHKKINEFANQLLSPTLTNNGQNQLAHKTDKKDEFALLTPVCIASISKDGQVLNYAGIPVKCSYGTAYYLSFENAPLYPDNYVAKVTFVNGTYAFISPCLGINGQGSLCLQFNPYFPNNGAYYLPAKGSASIAFFVALYKLY